MQVIGIGNAIVDVLCRVDDNFLKQNSLIKSTMKLIDEKEFKNLLSNLTIEETISGGSVANSIVGLSQLGNSVGFVGKVNDDDLGQKYEKNLVALRLWGCFWEGFWKGFGHLERPCKEPSFT